MRRRLATDPREPRAGDSHDARFAAILGVEGFEVTSRDHPVTPADLHQIDRRHRDQPQLGTKIRRTKPSITSRPNVLYA